jgi:competence protein ComEC
MTPPDQGRTRSRARTWPQPIPANAIRLFGAGAWTAWIMRLRDWARIEVREGQMLHWVPVAFGTGIAAYFSTDREPVALVAAATGLVLCGLCFVLRHRNAFPLMVMVTALAAGFATATLKTAYVSHPVLMRSTPSVALKGFVETYEERERTDRFVLRVDDMDSLRHADKLDRVRLSVRKGTAPAVGSFVELKARLSPPLTPLRPGSYDFARDMYFQGIGASGFVMGGIKVTAPTASGGWWLRYAAALQNMRDAVDARIRTVVSGDSRAIATALLTGRRDAISTPVNDAMFISGLGHVLSISGYHMAVVAGVIFFAVRALLALVPVLTVRYPIKKWAAAIAMAAAAFYLVLSGSDVATQRSFLMTAVVLLAVIVDRRAVTFRTLAIAALLVLLLAPEALVHPSFQMSYAATLGLVALISHGMPRLFSRGDNSLAARAALWGAREVMTLAFASTIAGMATMPYAAYHFHRVTPYGVLANLAAMPVVSAVVMPAGMLGIVAMPFGCDGIFWRLMDLGIQWMILVAQWVTALPGAIGRMPAFGTGPLLAATAGMIVLGLLRTPLRWAGGVVIVLSTIWALATPQPDILISADGHNVGVRGRDGRFHMMRTGKDAFLIKEWLAADADARSATDPSLADGVSCDGAGCVVEMRDGGLVSMAMRPDALADDCIKAEIIVVRNEPPADCAALVIDRNKLRRFGTLALRRVADSFRVDADKPNGLDRPWSPASPAEQDSSGTPLERSRSPLRDATPAPADLQVDD